MRLAGSSDGGQQRDVRASNEGLLLDRQHAVTLPDAQVNAVDQPDAFDYVGAAKVRRG